MTTEISISPSLPLPPGPHGSRFSPDSEHREHGVHHGRQDLPYPTGEHPSPEALAHHCLSSVSESCSVVSDSVTPWIYNPWNSPGQNTGVGSLSLLQGASQPRDQTQDSRNASGFFIS